MQPHATPADSLPNPFRYGWRYLKHLQANGEVELEQVPLTLEDVLHPQEGDVIPERTVHELDCRYLANVFSSRPITPPVGWVTADLLIDWGIAGLRPHSPDIAVFAGMQCEPDPAAGTLHLARMGGQCLLVVEVVSPDTRNNDVIHKVQHYHRAHVPWYILIDQERDHDARRLIVYRWTPKRYLTVALDAQGRFLIEALGLALSLRDERVLCHDAVTGRELGDYSQVAHELDEADRRIQEQERALEEAIQRNHEELRERKKAEQKARAQRKALNEEKKARKLAEERVRELEAALRHLQGGAG